MIGCGNIHKNSSISVVIVRSLRDAEDDESSDSNKGEKVPEGLVGEIWIKSDSKAIGYWGEKQKSEETFNGLLLPDHTDGWLRTGDLGFVYDEELFIAGREKDVIILRGRNHFPQDVEYTVQTSSPSGVRPGGCAAFSISSGAIREAHETLVGNSVAGTLASNSAESEEIGESLAVVAEVRNEKEPVQALQKLCDDISRSILTDHGISPELILLLKPHGAVKTTSGKIARKWNKRALLELAELNQAPKKQKDKQPKWHPKSKVVLFSWLRSSSADTAADTQNPEDVHTIEELEGPKLAYEVRRHVANLLGASGPAAIPTNVPLHAIGLDSMGIIQLNGILAHQQNLQLSQEQMFAEGLTIWWIQENASKLRSQGVDVGLPSAAEGRVDDPEVANVGSDEELQKNAFNRPSKSKRAEFCEKNCPCCICCW